MDEQNFYAAPQAQLEPGWAMEVEGQGQLASRLQRFLAYLVDYFALMLAYIPMIVLIVLFPESDALALAAMGLSGIAVLGVFALNIWMLHDNGQTIGKRVLGIKIVRGDRMTRASTPRLVLGRYLLIMGIGQIPCLGAIFVLVNYLMIFGEQKRCGHDHIVDTHVVVDDGVVGRTPAELAAAGGAGAAGRLVDRSMPDPYGGFDDFYGAEPEGVPGADGGVSDGSSDEDPLW